MLGLTVAAPRLSAAARGAALGLAAAAKFAPLALAPLFATAGGARRMAVFGLALAAVLVAVFGPFVPDGGLREIYDRTVGYQASRPSPFSVWGQAGSLDWLQIAVQGAAVLLALAVALVPRRKTPVQVAALAAAVLIAVQLGVTHWFYLYVVWFAPLALVALMAPLRDPGRPSPLDDPTHDRAAVVA
jgi:hypothetical protein